MVIGILLALQINNWNNQRQARNFEKNLLNELRNSIISDCSTLNSSIRRNEGFQSSCKIILSHMDNDLRYHDTLGFHFMNANLWWQLLLSSKSKFEDVKTYGLHIIKDDTTRSALSNLYDGSIAFTTTIHERQDLYYYHTAIPILTELFEETSAPIVQRRGIRPYDFRELKKSKKYRNLLNTNLRNRSLENGQYGFILSRLERLDRRLAKEIESK